MNEMRDRLTTVENRPSNDESLSQLNSALKTMYQRLSRIENEPARTIEHSEIHAALEDHPLVTEFRAFADKWRNK